MARPRRPDLLGGVARDAHPRRLRHFFEDDLDGLSNALGDLRVAPPADISRTSVKDADVIAIGK